MDRLSVYDDYVQTIRLLRGARNRVINGIESCRHPKDPEMMKACQALVNDIHEEHLKLGQAIVEALDLAMKNRDVKQATDMSNKLHRYNRYTVKLTRMFEKDIEENHPKPPDEDEDDEKDRPVDPTRPVQIRVFYSNLMTLKNKSAQKPRPATPKPST